MTVTGISPTSHGFTVLTDHQKQKGRCCNPCLRRESEFQARIRRKWLCTCKAARTYDGSGRTCSGSIKSKESSVCQSRGVRTDAVVTAICHGQPTASDHGELQITAYGISGIPVFQISRYIAKSLYLKQDAKVNIDFLPAFTEEAFFEFLLKRRNGREQMTCADYLLGIFHQKLIPRFLEQARIRMHTLTGDLSDTQIKSLVQVVKNNVVTIDTTNGFDNAQVCAGGISTEEITPDTMESRYVRHLYLAGELLDVDGICGGYNLQWAWATGYLAGTAAANDISSDR